MEGVAKRLLPSDVIANVILNPTERSLLLNRSYHLTGSQSPVVVGTAGDLKCLMKERIKSF